jgi:hypothetical protein
VPRFKQPLILQQIPEPENVLRLVALRVPSRAASTSGKNFLQFISSEIPRFLGGLRLQRTGLPGW